MLLRHEPYANIARQRPTKADIAEPACNLLLIGASGISVGEQADYPAVPSTLRALEVGFALAQRAYQLAQEPRLYWVSVTSHAFHRLRSRPIFLQATHSNSRSAHHKIITGFHRVTPGRLVPAHLHIHGHAFDSFSLRSRKSRPRCINRFALTTATDPDDSTGFRVRDDRTNASRVPERTHSSRTLKTRCRRGPSDPMKRASRGTAQSASSTRISPPSFPCHRS
jgi:hypothetical protein